MRLTKGEVHTLLRKSKQVADKSASFRVFVHEDVLIRSSQEVQASPDNEVGGKFVGFIVWPGSEPPQSEYWMGRTEDWHRLSAIGPAILLVGTISSGPGAARSPSSLVPDADFQVSVFRSLESWDGNIEHLGSWHSHHPNGLSQFSDGDRNHYASSVGDKNYNVDIFVAGLCFSKEGLRGGMFELYTRKDPRRPARLDRTCLITEKHLPSIQRRIDLIEKELASRARAVMAANPSLRDQTIGEIDRQLRWQFPKVSAPIIEKECVSWRVGSDNGTLDAGLTYAGGPIDSIAVSLAIRSGTSTLRFEGIGLSDFEDLLHKFTDTERRLGHAFSAAQSALGRP